MWERMKVEKQNGFWVGGGFVEHWESENNGCSDNHWWWKKWFFFCGNVRVGRDINALLSGENNGIVEQMREWENRERKKNKKVKNYIF